MWSLIQLFCECTAREAAASISEGREWMRGRRRLSAWKEKCLIASGTAALARWRPAKLHVGPNPSEDNEERKRGKQQEVGGGRRQEGELLVGEAGRRLKERACGLCGQQQLERDAVLAIGQRASAFIQSCGQSFKKKSTPDAFVFSATHLKRQMTQPQSGREGKYINTSAR